MNNANDQLRHFTGTSNWYRHLFTGLLYTDGIKAMAVQFQAYWLIDLVFSHQVTPRLQKEAFQTWELNRIKGNQFLATCTDGNENILCKQVIPFSDFSADTLKMFYTNGVLMLPSEY
ncbi:hypothetical protein BH10BAC3_BH10BAC3_12110 [soil metagenome]